MNASSHEFVNFYWSYTVEKNIRVDTSTTFIGRRKSDNQKVRIRKIVAEKFIVWGRLDGCDVPLEMYLYHQASLNNSGVISICDWFKEDNLFVMITEQPSSYINFKTIVDKFGIFLDESAKGSIFLQMVKILKTCHTNGVFHQDIKIENFIFCRETLAVKLIDFQKASSKSTLKSWNKRKEQIDCKSLCQVFLYIFKNLFDENPSQHHSSACLNLFRLIITSKKMNMPTIYRLLHHPWLKKLELKTLDSCK